MVRDHRNHTICVIVITLFSGLFSFYTAYQYYLTRLTYSTANVGRVGRLLSSIFDTLKILPQGCLQYVSIAELVVLLVCFILTLALGLSLMRGRDHWLRFAYRRRWCIGFLLFAVCVFFQLNGTSLHEWAAHTGNSVQSAPLWGRSREIRADEWAVWTPMALSQGYVGYPALSPLIAGGGTETIWSSVGGLPAWNCAVLFKPFYWGFLLFDLFSLNIGFGLSFLWTARWVFGALISFEFGMLLTKGSPRLSFMMALMIVFCPYIQWWYSQSAMEVLVFSEASLLCLWRCSKSVNPYKRVGYSALAAWSLGCLTMVAYPSWIIPQIEVTIVLALVLLVRNRKCLRKADIAVLGLPFLAVVVGLLFIVSQSYETLLAVSRSIYPGQRLFTGKYLPEPLFTGLASMLFSFVKPTRINECELAGVFSLAPAGLLLSLDVICFQKKKDGILIACLLMNAVYFAVVIFGISPWLAQLTLFSQCTRLYYIIGVLDLFCLFRALSLNEKHYKWPVVLLLTALCVTLNVYMAGKAALGDVQLLGYVCCGVICLVLFPLVFSYHKRESRVLLTCVLTLVMLACGGFINPVEKGVACVDSLDAIQAIRAVQDEKEDNWICTDFGFGNLPLLAGKHTPFSTHEYPDLDYWRFFDPDGDQEEIYNRFLWLVCSLSDEPTAIIPSQSGTASMALNMNYHDLAEIGIHYVVTNKVINEPMLMEVSSKGLWHVYHVMQ